MAATVWKGHLTFGLISIPIRLHSAARSERMSFNQLHKECHSRIKQPTWCPTCERMVNREEIVKGHEYEKDKYVLVEDEELERVAPPSARTMEILEFVRLAEIDPVSRRLVLRGGGGRGAKPISCWSRQWRSRATPPSPRRGCTSVNTR
jgi:DNA end-binding protein Ku